MQIIHAVHAWFWIEACSNRRAEPGRGLLPVKPVDLGVFIAYFPTWLKYHELYRLGAYGHPYDFISTNYASDLNASQDYQVQGTEWEKSFAALGCSVNEPFAFLTPARQDGSALGGPFLPTKGLNLTEIHEMMHLGSIWSIGPPVMPSVVTEFIGNNACYSYLAFPDHWRKEVHCNNFYRLFSPDFNLCDMSKAIEPFEEDGIEYLKENPQFNTETGQGVVHIGARMGSLFNPGWTTQLPAKDSTLICVDEEPHWCILSPGVRVNVVTLNHETSHSITSSSPSLWAKNGALEEEIRKLTAKNDQIMRDTTSMRETMKAKHKKLVRKLLVELENKKSDLEQSRRHLAVLRDTFNNLEGEGASSSSSSKRTRLV
ncbi:hypothetical protein LB507_003278 [Fusarium sp. FIESC RH6]|nr:hypothetical protein LB507_003278 [Fusarium sp. FIESC RH6]